MSQSYQIINKDHYFKGVKIERVINQTFLKQLNELSFKCNICKNIIINPHDCDICHSFFCFECIMNNSCPNKCIEFKISQSSKGIKTLLSKLKFKCINEQCMENIPYNEILNHDEECKFNIVKCPNSGCSQIFIRRDIEQHLRSDCIFSLIKCEICHLDFIKDIIQSHIKCCQGSEHTFNDEELTESIQKPKFSKKFMNIQYFENFTSNFDRIYKESNFSFNKIQTNLSEISNDISNNLNKIINEYQFHAKKDSSTQMKKESVEINNFKEIIDLISKNIVDIINKNLLMNIKKWFSIIPNKNIKDPINCQMEAFFNEFNNKVKILLSTSRSQIINQTISLIIDNFEKKDDNDNQINYESSDILQIKCILKSIDLNSKLIDDLIIDTYNENEIIQKEKKFYNKYIEKLKLSLEENITEIVTDKITEIEEYILGIKTLIIGEGLYTCFLNELDSANNELKWINKNFKEINSILKEEFDDIKGNFIKSELEGMITKLKEIIDSYMIKCFQAIKRQNNLKNEVSIDEIKSSIKNLYINDKLKKITDVNEIMNFNEFDNLKSRKKLYFEEIKAKKMFDKAYLVNQNIKTFDNVLKEPTINYDFNNQNDVKDFEKKIQDSTYLKLNDNQLNVIKKGLNSLDMNFENLAQQSVEDLSKNLSSINELRWCYQCKQLDYNFGFITCKICLGEKCKNCVSLCNGCTKLFCKLCANCSKCENNYCENCRKNCGLCKNKEKFCEDCINQCLYCKNYLCLDCSKKCMRCKTIICNLCSKFCNVCSKCACSRCEDSQNFLNCFFCKSNACNDCSMSCSGCYLDVCLNCHLKCQKCLKVLCKKCKNDCFTCKSNFCKNCTVDSLSIKCNLCEKYCCNLCMKNVKKCKGCSTVNCRNCYSVCRKCKTLFCNNCNINCDNCNEYICSSCTYKCVCDNFVFCEKCLLDINPISPHECIYFINDSPTFSGTKTRSKYALPKNFEAKLYLENFQSSTLLLGITDNSDFVSDSLTFIDNIWCIKVKTGEKYSSKFGLEKYDDKLVKEKDSIIIAKKNNQIFFRINFDQSEPAYTIEPNKNYYLYVENDNPHSLTKVVYVYIRNI